MNRRSFLKFGSISAATLIASPKLVLEWPADKPLPKAAIIPAKLAEKVKVEIFGLSDFIYMGLGSGAQLWAGERLLLPTLYGHGRWMAPAGNELLFTSTDSIRVTDSKGAPIKATWNFIARNDKNDFFTVSSTEPDRKIFIRGLK